MTVLLTGEINRKTAKTEAVEAVQLRRSVTPPSKPPSLPLIQYKTYLQSYYEKDPIARDDKLCIAPSSEFINLALVRHDGSAYWHGASFSGSTEGVSGGSLDLDSIVTPDSRFVLVEGDAGMGKSTLCWELCRKWDDLKSLQHYKIVALQKLREMRLQKATTLNEIFHHDNPALSKGVVDDMYRCEGEGVLVILDGFDEMPAKLIRDKESLIMRVISGACLPKATRLVTSRPSAIQYREHGFPQEYRHIKTLGFTDESIEQFAEKAFARNSEVLEHFKKFILSNPIIKSMMYIPVNCAILAQVYKDMKSSERMPKTMTQLYTTLVLVLIRRHMIERGKWNHGQRFPYDLNGLPDDVTAALKKISELAYSGLFKEEVQLVFSDDEVGECFEHLGLLSEAKEMYVSEGARSTYSFSHKSIQEFLAACCVAHFSDMISKPAPHEEKLDKVLLGYSQYKTFALFLCGLFGCNAEASWMWRKIYSSSNFGWGMGYFCLCLYESQDRDNFSFLMEESINFTSYSVRLSTPLDAYALGYCVARLPLQFVIEYIHTSLEPLLSSLHDHMHTGIFPGSIKYLEVENVDVLYPHRTTVQEVAKLIEIFNKKGKPISGICLRLTSVVRDIQWLTELIPALHLVAELSLDLFLQRPLEHDYLVYHQLLNLDLKFFSLKCPGCTKRGAQELHSVISTSTSLEEVTLKYSMAVVSDFCSLLYPPSCVDPFASYSVVGAVMSSPTVKRLVTNFAFTVSRNRNIQHIIFEIDYECVYPTAVYLFALCLDIRRILMSLWYCIEVKHDIGSFLPPESITLRINTDVLDNFYPTCNFVAILNKYLLLCDKPTQVIVQSVTCCSQKITSYSSVERYTLPQVSSFSRALRREPYLSSCTLKKAQSLEDLNQAFSLIELKPIYTTWESCPNLLELDELTKIHPHIDAAIS